MTIMSYNVDDNSFYGSILSIGFYALGQFLAVLDVENSLHNIALILSIVISIDTLTGSRVKKFITSLFKKK